MKDPALKPVHPGEILLEDFLKPLSHFAISSGQGDPCACAPRQ
jgi:hypothetical protein